MMRKQKMRILLTGAFGNVGCNTLRQLLARGYEVNALELDTPRNRKVSREFGDKVNLIWGDLRDFSSVTKATCGCDAIIHAGAVIPPLADQKPQLVYDVTIGGTRNIIHAAKAMANSPRLIFTSSIAIYGDRREVPFIRIGDELKRNEDDEYAKSKIACEELIRASGLPWTIFRLSFIVSAEHLAVDPLFFHVPWDTCIEICDSRDVAVALTSCLSYPSLNGSTLNLAGGSKCRIVYKDFVDRMFDLFGLGINMFPNEAFNTKGFHCAFMDTEAAQKMLCFQHHTRDDFFADVRKKYRVTRMIARPFRFVLRPLVRWYLLRLSPFWISYKKQHHQDDAPSAEMPSREHHAA